MANQVVLEQKVPSINNKDIVNNTNTCDLSNEMFNFTNSTKDKVVKFIRNKETFCKGTEECIHDSNLPKNVFKTEDTEESYTLEFQNAVNDLVEADNASQLESNLNISKTNVINNEVNDNITNDNQSDTQNLNNCDEFDIPMIVVNTGAPIETLREGILDYISTNKINTPPKSDKMKCTQVSIDSGEVKNDVEELSNKNIKQNSNHVSDTAESDDELKVQETFSNVRSKPGDNNANSKNPTKSEDSGETSKVSEAKSEESDDLERKLLELEQEVLNRFKGSLLDKMF